MQTNELAEALARKLRHAQACRQPIPPLRDEIDSEELAYAVQLINVRRAVKEGRRIVGRKIGLTSLAVQQQLGVSQPDFGTLFSDMLYGDDEPIPWASLIQPKVEVEIALVLEHDLDREDLTLPELIRATAYALPAIEVVDSRIANWNIKFMDTVADNASSGSVVLGAAPRTLDRWDMKKSAMTLMKGRDLISSGAGSACLGHPLSAALWLARKLASLSQPLRAGDLVMTGALGPMVAATPSTRYEASIEGLGEVYAQFD